MSGLKERGVQKTLVDQSSGAFSKYCSLIVGTSRFWYLVKFELITMLFLSLPGALGLWLRQKTFPLLFRSCGQGVVFGRNITLRHPLRISLGDNVIIHDDVTLDAKGTGGDGISIGPGGLIGTGPMLARLDGTIEIESGASIGCYCRIGSSQITRICQKALLASYVHVNGAAHGPPRTQ